ncbi:hypothetical protein [Pedobacter sp. BMA]|uniref:hypothetical protein n=1 Tax=Pedobacter sp. BMA TaxID=1663685 RepID=UPI0006499D49|nr:hypothetical protein [Pedobacter sp. BMA]KLT67165.1 hypothetical protein AB669_00015 [Pedobacter sp. BMA]
MKNSILITFIALFCLSGCDAQIKKNPKYLGSKFGNFNLDAVTFAENLDTLFSKSTGSFKRSEKGNSSAGGIVGYQYFLNSKNNQGLKVYFIDEQFNDVKSQFILDQTGKFAAVKLSQVSAKPIDILSKINQKYGKYEVKLKIKNALHNYQWDTPKKYISLAYSDKMEGEGYLYYLLITEKKRADSKFDISHFSNPIQLCLDKSCKE